MSDLASGIRLVKICGVTSVYDATVVRDAGADALGVNFTVSKRRVDAKTAREIVRASAGLTHVGIFGDEPGSTVVAMIDASGVNAVQIHGPLDDDLLKELRRRDLGVVKALSIGSAEFFAFDETRVDAVLVDGQVPGSGREHSWEALDERDFAVPVIAAGGLNAHNVVEVIEKVRPWGVDVATGVESSPGVKDPVQVARFVAMATSALARGAAT